MNKELEGLAYSINKYIDIDIENKIKQKHIEDEFKKAIANIAHDLRTHLTAVIGYIQIIKSKNSSYEKQLEHLNIDEIRSKSLQKLVIDFFQLSVIESHEYQFEIEYVSINNILCEVITLFYYNFQEKNIIPKIKLPKGNIMVLGNEGAIKCVIENLIINIIKHSIGEVCIELKKYKDEDILTTINVANNIDNKHINLMFNRFYKEDKSRGEYSSTGLGLSIVKGLMEKMNGKIYAEIRGNLLYMFCNWKLK